MKIENILKNTELLIESDSEKNLDELNTILKFSNISQEEHFDFNRSILDKACINIHFHPDRYTEKGQVIDNLIETGEYKNQFQTKISSRSLTAQIGNERDIWENKLFNNIFGTNTEFRPKYGSLNLTTKSDGASPRFGSCYFISNPEIKQKCTFTYGDSYLLPKERGTIKNFTLIYAKLYDAILTRHFALGQHFNKIKDFINSTKTSLNSPIPTDINTNNLDFYIEAQIHGKIELKKDISSLVVDYSFKGTAFEKKFQTLCNSYSISLIWNLGYQLNVNEFPDDFRGMETLIFARKIAENNIINAYIIGKAITNEELKSKYDELDFFQLSKYVWHCLVKFGKQIKPTPNRVGWPAGN